MLCWPHLLMAAAPILMAAGYEAEIAAWRAQRESNLKADTGWLTVAGLFWLKDGTNTFGSASTNDIVLPRGAAPAPHGGRRPAILRFPRSDRREGNLSRRPLPLCRHAARRIRRARFQQSLQPAVRLHPVRHLPAAAGAESPACAHRSR